jgi:putative ABC transport system permease protein
LYGVSPQEPRIFAVTAALLTLVAAAACLVPAWRATRVDPSEALRSD